MKFIILMLTSCLLISSPLLTMEQRTVIHIQKKARGNGTAVIIKQENNDDFEVETIKKERVDAPVACAASSSQGILAQDPVPERSINADSDLFAASQNGNVELIRELLQRWGIENYHRNILHRSLHSAIENGHENVVRLLLVTRPEIDINHQLPARKQAFFLTTAAAVGNVEIVRMLLGKPDINVNIKSNAKTALMYAAENGYEEIVRLLLSDGNITVNEQGRAGLTALMYASMKGHSNVVRLLLERPNIDINIQNGYITTALILAIEKGHNDVVQILLSNPQIKVNSPSITGRSALCTAIAKNRRKIIETLLERDDLTISTKEAALVTAARCENRELVTILLAHCPTSTDAQEKAFQAACLYAHAEIVRLLLNLPGININSLTAQGKTGLMEAIEPSVFERKQSNARKEIVKMLLNRPEIAINIQDHEGWTALMYAVKCSDKEIVQMLLDKPGDRHKCSKYLNRLYCSYGPIQGTSMGGKSRRIFT